MMLVVAHGDHPSPARRPVRRRSARSYFVAVLTTKARTEPAIIAPRRSNSAHLHRPWRATSVQNWALQNAVFARDAATSVCRSTLFDPMMRFRVHFNALGERAEVVAAVTAAVGSIRMIARRGSHSSPSVISAATRRTLAIGSLGLDPGGVDDDFPVAYLF